MNWDLCTHASQLTATGTTECTCIRTVRVVVYNSLSTRYLYYCKHSSQQQQYEHVGSSCCSPAAVSVCCCCLIVDAWYVYMVRTYLVDSCSIAEAEKPCINLYFTP